MTEVDFGENSNLRVSRTIKVPIHDWVRWGAAAESVGASTLAFIVACCNSAADKILGKE